MATYNITLCPFYQHEALKSVTCEGYVCCKSLTQIRFKTAKDKLEFQLQFCRTDGWYRCPLAIQLYNKYEEE